MGSVGAAVGAVEALVEKGKGRNGCLGEARWVCQPRGKRAVRTRGRRAVVAR